MSGAALDGPAPGAQECIIPQIQVTPLASVPSGFLTSLPELAWTPLTFPRSQRRYTTFCQRSCGHTCLVTIASPAEKRFSKRRSSLYSVLGVPGSLVGVCCLMPMEVDHVVAIPHREGPKRSLSWKIWATRISCRQRRALRVPSALRSKPKGCGPRFGPRTRNPAKAPLDREAHYGARPCHEKTHAGSKSLDALQLLRGANGTKLFGHRPAERAERFQRSAAGAPGSRWSTRGKRWAGGVLPGPRNRGSGGDSLFSR